MNGQPPARPRRPSECPAGPAAPHPARARRPGRASGAPAFCGPGRAGRPGHGGRQGRGHHAQEVAEKPPTESTMDPYWGRQTFQYKTEEPAPPPEEKKPVDTTAPEMAALRRQMSAIQQELEALKNRKTPATAVKPADKGGQPVRVTPAPTQFITHAEPKEDAGGRLEGPTYTSHGQRLSFSERLKVECE